MSQFFQVYRSAPALRQGGQQHRLRVVLVKARHRLRWQQEPLQELALCAAHRVEAECISSVMSVAKGALY